VDRGVALSRARAHATWIENAKPQVFLGGHSDALKHAQWLRTATLEDVLYVEFGDDRQLTCDFSLWRGEAIRFAYSGAAEEQLKGPLVNRCARALDCGIVVI
jgi:hypothetical protein